MLKSAASLMRGRRFVSSIHKAGTATDFDVAVKKEAIHWLYEYNLDDIWATFAVREYVRSFDL